jgi:hypothetical protein
MYIHYAAACANATAERLWPWANPQGKSMATTALKTKAYPGVQLLAAASIEANGVEQALRAAQFRFDRALHDLRSEFIVRENKLRDEYLAEVAEITGGSGD